MGLISRVSSRTYRFGKINLSIFARNLPLKPSKMAPTNKSKKSKKSELKFTIDCTQPVDDSILDIANFNAYLKEKIKANGKLDNLENITIENTPKQLIVTAKWYFSKRYLKKNSLREWLRVVADDKSSYTLKYFNINNDEEE